MATINGRKVRFRDEAGRTREGIARNWEEGCQWVKVQVTDGMDDLRQQMVHESEWLEIVRNERAMQ